MPCADCRSEHVSISRDMGDYCSECFQDKFGSAHSWGHDFWESERCVCFGRSAYIARLDAETLCSHCLRPRTDPSETYRHQQPVAPRFASVLAMLDDAPGMQPYFRVSSFINRDRFLRRLPGFLQGEIHDTARRVIELVQAMPQLPATFRSPGILKVVKTLRRDLEQLSSTLNELHGDLTSNKPLKGARPAAKRRRLVKLLSNQTIGAWLRAAYSNLEFADDSMEDIAELGETVRCRKPISPVRLDRIHDAIQRALQVTAGITGGDPVNDKAFSPNLRGNDRLRVALWLYLNLTDKLWFSDRQALEFVARHVPGLKVNLAPKPQKELPKIQPPPLTTQDKAHLWECWWIIRKLFRKHLRVAPSLWIRTRIQERGELELMAELERSPYAWKNWTPGKAFPPALLTLIDRVTRRTYRIFENWRRETPASVINAAIARKAKGGESLWGANAPSDDGAGQCRNDILDEGTPLADVRVYDDNLPPGLKKLKDSLLELARKLEKGAKASA